MGITIRNINKSDYQAVSRLIENELGYRVLSLEDFCTRLDLIAQRNDFRTLVAEIDNHVVGFIGLQRCLAYEFTGEYLRVVALAVHAEHQHKGVGTKLILAAEEFAVNEGIHGITLDSGLHRSGAHVFYEKAGFCKGGYQFGKDIANKCL